MEYPTACFAVLSDPHIYAPQLGLTGPAFERFLAHSPNMPVESPALLHRAVDEILESPAEFLLIPGDLTNYGEAVSHRLAVAELSRLRQAGKRVFVVPGNHDIWDGLAYQYRGRVRRPVPSVAPAEFVALYDDLGYRQAFCRDEHSLSYGAEVAPGLWLLALDTCRYDENRPGCEPVVGGRLRQGTRKWLAGMLEEARCRDKAVMVMCHHGLVEHWDGQHWLRWNYILPNYRELGRYLAQNGVRLGFTGHDHASDIACLATAAGPFYDVSTGSLASTGHTWRLCRLAGDRLTVETTSLRDSFLPGTDFSRRSRRAIERAVYRKAYRACRAVRMPPKDADYLAKTLAVVFRAHNEGDEDPTRLPHIDPARLGALGRMVYASQRFAFENLTKNPWPPDNQAVLHWPKNS